MARALMLCIAIFQRCGFTDARTRALSFIGRTSTFAARTLHPRWRTNNSFKDGFLFAQSSRCCGSKFATNVGTSPKYLSLNAKAESLIYDFGQYTNDNPNVDSADQSLRAEQKSSRPYVLHKALFHAVQNALQNLNKKTTSLQRELEKAQSLEETMARANLIVSNLYRLNPGTTSIDVEDWENGGKIITLELNTKDYSSAQEESDALFARARKMKRGSLIVQDLLNTSLEAEAILKDIFTSLTGSMDHRIEVSFDDISPEMHLDEGALVLIRDEIERTSEKTGVVITRLEDIIEDNSCAEPNGNKVQKSERDSRYKPNPRELISPSGHKGKNCRVHSLLGTRTVTLMIHFYCKNCKFLWGVIDATMKPFVFNYLVPPIFGCIRVVVLEHMFYFVSEEGHRKSQMTICNLQLIWQFFIVTTEQNENHLLQQQNQST